MPVTKRQAHYGSPKELIDYILDEKHNGEKAGVVSSINCNVETAFQEFRDIQNKYKMGGTRVAYHIIQSFSPLDDITKEEANEIGKKLCEELYSNYQCVISTHIDKGHIHNHICVNAINLDGVKLEDRLANEKEGLYALSDTSDRITGEYGCFIMPRKTYLNNKNKDYYHQYKKQSWKEKIKLDIEDILPKCNTFDEFIDELSINGYKIKRGKNLSVKCEGMERFARLNTIDERLSSSNLYKFFKNKDNAVLEDVNITENKFNLSIIESVIESKTAIEKSNMQVQNKKYSEYQKTKYMEIKRYYKLKQQLEYLEKYNITSFDDIEQEIEIKRSMIKSANIVLKKKNETYKEILEKTEKAQDYIRLYETYKYAMSYKEQDPQYIFPKEVEIFLKLQKELGIENIEQAKRLIKSTREERIEINKMKNNILEIQRELNHLDTIKEEKLSASNLFIHNIKFGGNHIKYEKSDDKFYCIELPYTKDIIYIPKKYTAYNEKYQYYTLYLVDDMEYGIFNDKEEKVDTLTGTGLERSVLEKKKEIDYSYNEFNIY